MNKFAKNKSYPIGHYIKIIFLCLLSALILNCVISFAAIYIVKNQSTGYLEDTAELYMNRIDHDFAYITHYMGWTLVNDENVSGSFADSADYSAELKAGNLLFKRFSELQKNYGQEYNFFLYSKVRNAFMNCAPMNISYKDYKELHAMVVSYTEETNVYKEFYSNWSPVRINGQYYMINIVPYHNVYMIGLVSAADLIRPLGQINLGKSGYVSLVNHDGTVLFSPKLEQDKVPLQDTANALFKPRSNITKAFANASLHVRMVIQFGTFEKIMITQLLIMLLFLIITFTLCAAMLYFNKKVFKPIQSFTKNLTLINEDERSLDFKSSKIAELEQVNTRFKILVEQISRFKIDMYEQEMEKQRIQLAYMKLQINPHFFLNCLTTIYSMAQMQMHDEIEKMTLAISKYFRYIFQSDRNFVRLQDEVEHVRTYLDIQRSRYQDAFRYDIQLGERTEESYLPPLVLQTFIENAVKYAVSRVNQANIRLTVTRLDEEEDKIMIRFSDNGPGFPAPILAQLTRGEPLCQAEGTQIGIMNTLERLDILYNKRAEVHFANLPGGGACVTLILPRPAED